MSEAYVATFSYVVTKQLYCFASGQFVVTVELLSETRSLLCVMHYEYDAGM